MDRGARLQRKDVGQSLAHAPADKYLPWLSLAHQTGGEVHLVTHDPIGAAGYAAIGTGPHSATANPNLERREGAALCRALPHLQRSLDSAAGIIFVSDRCAKGSREITALIADGHGQQDAFIAGQHRLAAADEPIQL